MGRVTTEVLVENLEDAWQARSGTIPDDQVRRLVIPQALVDSGAMTLALPTRFIHQLGLRKVGEKRATSTAGITVFNVYDAVRVTIQGRFCTTDVTEVPDVVPVLVGQVPLELLDLVIDMRAQKLIPNPAHGGEHMLEML